MIAFCVLVIFASFRTVRPGEYEEDSRGWNWPPAYWSESVARRNNWLVSTVAPAVAMTMRVINDITYIVLVQVAITASFVYVSPRNVEWSSSTAISCRGDDP